MSDEQDDGRTSGESGAIRGVMGRLLSGAERELRSGERLDAAKEAIGTVLETGDKAKTEVVRMVAREVRAYLDALEVKDDLKELLEDYELEVNATFKLKPLLKAAPEQSDGEETASAKEEPPVGGAPAQQDTDEG